MRHTLTSTNTNQMSYSITSFQGHQTRTPTAQQRKHFIFLAVCAAVKHWSPRLAHSLRPLLQSIFPHSAPAKRQTKIKQPISEISKGRALSPSLQPQSRGFKAALWKRGIKKHSIWLLPATVELFCEWTNMPSYLWDLLDQAVTCSSFSLMWWMPIGAEQTAMR